MMPFATLGDAMLALGLTLPRIIGAFVMLPLITQSNMPPMVRNSFLVSLAIVALPVAMTASPGAVAATLQWPMMVLKELFVGVAIGFCFGIVFWAISAAGSVIDSQVGMSMAQIFDPIQGHQTTLHGEFLSEFAAWVFMASGAFLIFLDLLMSSYAIWPPTSFFPNLAATGVNLFVGHFSFFMTTVLVLAAPAIVILLVIDMSFGLVNRYAPQLNVFALTLPIKAWLATGIILMMLGVFIEVLVGRLGDSRALVELLNRIFA
ncbi:type III secretion system export apparatus subunit SctT [Luteimonas sp. YGD11-2]|uniref:type III secretion system export apparatus subunit SctT n=1 Tax=Luteimonas sp. YGD11-2 TaxID=2508168 RepID=UPI00100AC915|nr:type III secretion system export apparatus subunit SctT [Luteimonas sp. YGD11-2]